MAWKQFFGLKKHVHKVLKSFFTGEEKKTCEYISVHLQFMGNSVNMIIELQALIQ